MSPATARGYEPEVAKALADFIVCQHFSPDEPPDEFDTQKLVDVLTDGCGVIPLDDRTWIIVTKDDDRTRISMWSAEYRSSSTSARPDQPRVWTSSNGIEFYWVDGDAVASCVVTATGFFGLRAGVYRLRSRPTDQSAVDQFIKDYEARAATK